MSYTYNPLLRTSPLSESLKTRFTEIRVYTGFETDKKDNMVYIYLWEYNNQLFCWTTKTFDDKMSITIVDNHASQIIEDALKEPFEFYVGSTKIENIMTNKKQIKGQFRIYEEYIVRAIIWVDNGASLMSDYVKCTNNDLICAK